MLLLLLGRFSRFRLCDPIDGSPPGSAVPGILQARTLEWVAISLYVHILIIFPEENSRLIFSGKRITCLEKTVGETSKGSSRHTL